MDDDVYENQPLELPVRFTIDMSGKSAEADYKDPNGGTGTINGTVSGQDAVFQIAQGFLTPAGKWCFQAFAVDGANRWPAEKTEMIVKEGC